MQCTIPSVSQVLTEKVDSALSGYPKYPYQTALNNKFVKQILLDYIETKLKQTMPCLNQPEKWQRLPHYLHQLIDLELRLESYIYWGIEYIIQNQLDLLMDSEQNPRPSCSVQDMAHSHTPSHWFG
ncbi:MAG: hypothetical protein AAFY17_14535 [Cyanobacteria bacterium J06642_11]